MIDNSSLFIVEVVDDGEKFEYEYGNIKHAEEHYNNENVLICMSTTKVIITLLRVNNL